MKGRIMGSFLTRPPHMPICLISYNRAHYKEAPPYVIIMLDTPAKFINQDNLSDCHAYLSVGIY